MDTPIIAGRFAPLAGSFALDLATAERVSLQVEAVREGSHQHMWAEQCAALSGLWHASLAECVDFGLLGSDHRFLAFRACRQAVHHASGSFDRLRRHVEAFLSACGVTATVTTHPYSDTTGRIVAVPTIDAPDAPVDPATWRNGAADRWFGIRLVPRAVLQIIVERLTLEPTPGITVFRIEATPGSGGRTLLRHCASEARRLGYVPLGSAALLWATGQPPSRMESWLRALSRNHLAVLHDGRRGRFEDNPELVRALLRMGSRQRRPLVVIELTPVGGVQPGVRLAPLSVRELAGMVVCDEASPRHQQRIEAAARTCRGRPGPFVQRLMRIYARRAGGRPARVFTVHEHSAAFGAQAPGQVSQRAWGGPSGLRPAGLTARPGTTGAALAESLLLAADTAGVLCGRGRHAAAIRTLRQAEAAAARRRLWSAAAALALKRGRVCAARGDFGAADQSLLAALEYCDRAGDVPASVVAVTAIGSLRLEDGRIEEAESSLRSAVATATMIEEPVLLFWSATILALCLWWQGRNEEASRILRDAGHVNWEQGRRGPVRPADGRPSEDAVRVWHLCTVARVALALQDVAGARGRLCEAWRLAPPADSMLRGLVRRVEARWHVAVGDAPGFKASSGEAAALARAARQPLERLRAAAGYVEGCIRLAPRAEADAAVGRLERLSRQRLPGLLAIRIRMAVARWRGTLSHEQLAAECRARRLGALCPTPLPRDHPLAASFEVRSPMYDDVIEVLRICQEEAPQEALCEVLGVVRARTRAAGAEFVSIGNVVAVAAPSGGRRTAAAARALESGLAIEPLVTDRGTEAAVPLRFGGRVVGALACRWAGMLPLETPRLMGFLAAVAAAAAPCLGMAVDQQEPVATRRPADTELLGDSAAMEEIRRAVARAADAPFPVLIQGESGSGKELVARAVHRASARRGRVLCALNCAALPDDLLEAELFGHARGAFTGAVAERAGLFEDADGGVLFLDEVGELTPRAQAKLLRAIQEGEVKRIGETFARRVDVRIVAATNRPLDHEVAAGRFRRDLRYRLDVVRIVVPALRERPEDIPALAQHFWRSATERVGSRAVLSGAVMTALVRYDWPGNVRELQNVLASLAVAAPRRGIVGPGALPATVASTAVRGAPTTLDAARRVFEERYVRAALARSGGHRGRAAVELGLTRQGLAKLMGRLGVVPVEETVQSAEKRCAS